MSQLTLNSIKTEILLLGQQQFTQIYDNYTYTTFGEWEFSSDKEEIEFDPNDGDDYEWEINRLTNKELWVEDQYGNEWEWEKD